MNEINPFEKLSNDQVEELNRRLNPRVSNSLDGLVGDERCSLSEQEVWVKAWCATACASNTRHISTCDKYADGCLEAFRERFASPNDTDEFKETEESQ